MTTKSSLGLTGQTYVAAAMAAEISQALLDMGLSHSKRSYPTPPEKVVVGYP